MPKVRISFILAACILLAGCSLSPESLESTQTSTAVPNLTPSPQPTLTPTVEIQPTACVLEPVLIPTLPATIPGYTELDRTTGLHRTGFYTETIDLRTYRLEITGMVDHPLSLRYDDLRCMPKVEEKATLVCPGTFEDTTTWAGVPLAYILDLAGVQQGAKQIVIVGADGYAPVLDLERARREDALIAYEWKKEPLPILHGFPARTIFPGVAGSYWVKWLLKIEVK